MSKIKTALCQNKITNDKEETLSAAIKMVDDAAKDGAQLVVLPEMFTTPYTNKSMRLNKEPTYGSTATALADCAARNGIYLIGGSFPEENGNSLFNTCLIFDPSGNHIGTHRKAHLFDIDVEDKVTFKESDTFTAGNDVCVVDTEFGKIGVGICFDIRFPEYFRKLALSGCKILVVPASFARETGKAHWIISLRMRAVDNQCYMLGVSPSVNAQLPYLAYGHTAATDPWGVVLGELQEMPGTLAIDIDTEFVDKIRKEFPLLKSRRPELYK
jgi:predicted amidohydrolase